jgi:hypothetical protein
MMLTHHGALDKLKLFHLKNGGFYHQRDYKEVFNSLCLMAESLASYNHKIQEIYAEEIAQDKDELEYMIAGEIYELIYNDA